MTDDDLTMIRAALADRAGDLARHLIGEPNSALSGKTERRYGAHGSLAIDVAGAKAGLWFDHETGEGSDMVGLIMREHNCGFREAIAFARTFVGRGAPPAARRPTKAEHKETDDAKQLRLARFLWSQRLPIEGSDAAVRYLREARGYGGLVIPPTLGYLPARSEHGHALIAAFGFPEESGPGVLHMADEVRGVQVTRLLPDGSDRDRQHPKGKITIGRCLGAPIVCGPFSDSNNALVIAEGIEDALTAHQVMGIAAWAAGGASRMPALADAVHNHIDCVSVLVDGDKAGRINSAKLTDRIRERLPELEVRFVEIRSGAQ
jgi:Toprim domain